MTSVLAAFLFGVGTSLCCISLGVALWALIVE